MEPIVIIIRGVSGSGKSSLSEDLTNLAYLAGISYEICEADTYFYRNGNYEFNPKLLGEAHKYCRNVFQKAIEDKIDLIIVSNTSTTKSEANFYENLAKDNNYKVISLILENINNTKSIHNVPEDVLERQKKNLFSSTRL